ncbi:pyridoxamine 5'-phosphate oxidase family protein [Streptomyces albogriseolus]|uniref:pyridoxamine 5'-phosphate oxidase family protein n=1 Tax=Streptomyces albogriseolus TaxID=1887 RepID=UPI00370199F0
MYRNDGFRELNRQESLSRLAQVTVGRIVHTRDALPAVLPVNFLLEESGAVLLRTSASSELVRAVDGAVVAFEADETPQAVNGSSRLLGAGRTGGSFSETSGMIPLWILTVLRFAGAS